MYLAPITINKNLLLKMVFQKVKEFKIFTKVPPFYEQIITSYNSWKTIRPIYKLSDAELFTCPLCRNEYFKHKDKCEICVNWIKSGFLLAEDFVEHEDSFISEHMFHKN